MRGKNEPQESWQLHFPFEKSPLLNFLHEDATSDYSQALRVDTVNDQREYSTKVIFPSLPRCSTEILLPWRSAAVTLPFSSCMGASWSQSQLQPEASHGLTPYRGHISQKWHTHQISSDLESKTKWKQTKPFAWTASWLNKNLFPVVYRTMPWQPTKGPFYQNEWLIKMGVHQTGARRDLHVWWLLGDSWWGCWKDWVSHLPGVADLVEQHGWSLGTLRADRSTQRMPLSTDSEFQALKKSLPSPPVGSLQVLEDLYKVHLEFSLL